MIAFKPYSLAPVEQRPLGIPLQVPWIMAKIEESDYAKYNANGFCLMSDVEYDEFLISIQPEVDAWQAVRTQLSVEQTLQAAINFGTQCLREFSAQNVLMGITQSGMTGTILTILTGVMQALLAGSLYEAIARIKAVDPANYDGVYLNPTRCLEFVNKIEAYLGIPLSESL